MKIKCKNTIFFAIIIGSVFLYSFTSEKPKIFLIGDSTMADKPVEDNPERGWGQIFKTYFTDEIIIENHAVNGRSTKNFIKEGRWQKVFESLNSGDYVFIQFGHNDSKISDTNRYAEANTDYKNNLIRMIKDTKSKNATPVLITPVNRRKFDEKGIFIDQHGEYPKVVRQLAKEFNLPLLDLHQKSFELFSALGPERTKKLFLWVKPGEYKLYPAGKQDNTHFTSAGAEFVAWIIIDLMKEINSPIVKYLKPGLTKPDSL